MSEFENSGKWSWEIQKEQQAKIDELEKQLIAQGQRFNDLSQKLRDTEYRCDELQKRVDEISGYATELAEYASYAEIIGAVSHNRPVIREYCDKIFAYNRAIDIEEEKALRGEHE